MGNIELNRKPRVDQGGRQSEQPDHTGGRQPKSKDLTRFRQQSGGEGGPPDTRPPAPPGDAGRGDDRSKNEDEKKALRNIFRSAKMTRI